MKDSTKRILSIFGSLAGLFFALVLFSNNILPGWAGLSALRAEIGEKTAARNQLEVLVEQGRDYLARQAELEAATEPVDAALPAAPKIPELIAALNVLALENQASLGELRFELERYRPQPGVAAVGPNVSRVIVRASVTAPYSALKAWLRGVESELRLMDVQLLNLQSLAGEDQPAANTPLSAEVMLVSYWQQ